ncbi:protein O-mannosyl-transferase family [Elusimicrobiota bacterium]
MNRLKTSMKQQNTSRSSNYKYIVAAGCFIICLVLYFITACTTVPPYRDSGELITAAHTLGVAHSPGYPFYMVSGKFFITLGGLIGFSPAWSLNLFSSLAGAIAVFLLVLFIYESGADNPAAAAFGGLLAGFSYIIWYLSVVSEMYSLNLMLVALLLYLAINKKFILFSFIAGLTMGNHLTALFVIAPIIAYFLIEGGLKKIRWDKFVFYFAVGMSVYLYLPIRAMAQPLINWGEPSSLSSLMKVLSRASYGHTLDLISREVTLKQVFLPQLKIFGSALLRDITLPGLLLVVLGFTWGIKSPCEKNRSLLLLAIFMLTGPYFLYLAKMPTNPHAIAIVEVGYILPVAVLSVFAGWGLFMVMGQFKRKVYKYGIFIIAALILGYSAVKTYPRVNKKRNFFADDYALNILNTVEKDSIVIMRRDHTMFALWYKRDIEGIRKDVKVISKGLISAQWYRNKLRKDYPEIVWKEEYIDDEEYIKWIYNKYSGRFPVYITSAAAGELSNEFYKKYSIKPYGLVSKIGPVNTSYDADELVSIIEKKYVFNGIYNTEKHYDFFSRDFINLYAKCYTIIGIEYLKSDNFEMARKMYEKAMDYDPFFPKTYSNIAYSYYKEGDFIQSEKFYLNAIELVDMTMKKYTRKKLFRKEMAEYYNNLGTVYEKWLKASKDEEKFHSALNCYNRAVELAPEYSQAYYNLGVLYWNRDWNRVIENFKKALQYDPKNEQAKKYLFIANKNLRNRQ